MEVRNECPVDDKKWTYINGILLGLHAAIIIDTSTNNLVLKAGVVIVDVV